MDQIHKLNAINEAIWIRDNALRVSKEILIERIQDLAEYEVFSNRQLAKICLNAIGYNTIRAYVNKSDKSGGNLAIESLEDIREVLFSKERKAISLDAIRRVLATGTSQGMLSRLTGVSQTLISRSVTNER